MERVAFLIERTGERLGCLLNPESLVVRRTAGVRPRRSRGGLLTGAGLRDDPLLYTGGGTTELELDLLFDVSLAGSSIATEDVRELTAPLWQLAENAPQDSGYGRPPLVHFVWGKSWNLPGIVTAVAERLEHFSATGAPRRSWLRMRLVRAAESDGRASAPPPPRDWKVPTAAEVPPGELRAYETVGGGEGGGPGGRAVGERLDQIASRCYGDPGYWRLLAAFNNLDDPTAMPAGLVLRIPPLSVLEGNQ
jgi:hypothetical protein